MTVNTITIEKATRLSKSKLFEFQKDYFVRKGVNAWAAGEVPYYITCNPLIAYGYAQMVLRYLQDNLRNGTLNSNQPIYMFELATGSGKFSYLFLHHFSNFLAQFNLQHLKFCYVMTDFTENNMRYWQQHPQFQKYIQEGMLDFAIYEIGNNQDISLVNKKITLSTNSSVNPIMVVGNYTFDTVINDLFRVHNGKLEEGLLTVSSPQDNLDKNSKVISGDRLQVDFSYRETTLPYYNDPALDNALDYYVNNFGEGNFLVPTGMYESINNLKRISNGRMLLICADKGYTSMESINRSSNPHIAFHGSFSLMVNFDFISHYVKNLGGDTLLSEDHEGMKTNLFLLGDSFKNMPETSWANYEYRTHISTKEFLELTNILTKEPSQLDLDSILSIMKFSYWDPDTFFTIVSQLINLFNQASSGYHRTWRKGLKEIEGNYYFLNTYKNIPFELGRVYQLLGDMDEAIRFYDQSINNFGEDSSAHFNLGLCYYHKKALLIALNHFKKAVEINAENNTAKEWLTLVEKELTTPQGH